MTDSPQEPQDGTEGTGSPASEPFADPDPEATIDEREDDGVDPDERTVEPDALEGDT